MHSLPVLTVAALAPLLGSVHAFWRLECQGSTGLARLDPLMAFDAVGDHVHSIKGGSGEHFGFPSFFSAFLSADIHPLSNSFQSYFKGRRSASFKMHQLWRCSRYVGLLGPGHVLRAR